MKMRALWWWIDRWRKSTAFMDMTLEQQGAYRNLLDEAALRGGPLPTDERVLAKACGDALAWKRVRDVVMARFTLGADGWRNETLDQVLADSQEIRTTRAEAGRNGARKRWQTDSKPIAKQIANEVAETEAKPVANNMAPSPSPFPIVVPSELQKKKSGGGQAPLWRYPRFAVFRWMVDDLQAMLGPDSEEFDLDAWFQHLSDQAEAARVVIADPWKFIKTETLAEAKRRGLAIAVVEPVRDSLSSRLSSAVANIKREEINS